MEKMEWQRIGKGLECRNHPTRKHGVRFDRYFRGRYRVNKKETSVSFGWESEWVAGEKARAVAAGRKGSKKPFLEYCMGELAKLKENARKGSGPTTIKEERELAEIQKKEEDQARASEEKQALTFGEYFMVTYYPAAAVSKKHNTWKQEGSYFRVWLKPNIGRIRLIDIRPLHIEKVKRAMIKAKKAPRTIQAVLALARQVWNHARNNDIVKGDWPGRSVKAGRFDNRRMRFLTHDECETLIAKLRETSPQVSDIALLSLDTGMRAGEVFSLLWENVDMTAGQIRVVDAKAGNRVAYMTERVKSMLQGLPGDGGFVFPSKTGGRIGQISKTVERVISSLGLNAGITDPRNRATFHSLRHTFASRLVENGTDLYTVKELLGHSTLAMTERYSHVSNVSLQSAVKRMERATEEKAQEKKQADVIPLQVNGKE
ncbi:MAG: site-specific integrase [Nitrospina sp.]|jgi:integrase|nr:site-specific integrase [Nitrospina sp.]